MFSKYTVYLFEVTARSLEGTLCVHLIQQLIFQGCQLDIDLMDESIPLKEENARYSQTSWILTGCPCLDWRRHLCLFPHLPNTVSLKFLFSLAKSLEWAIPASDIWWCGACSVLFVWKCEISFIVQAHQSCFFILYSVSPELSRNLEKSSIM